MGFFFFRHNDTNEGVGRCAAEPGAVLLDVRTPAEYDGGHIEGSRNIPLQCIESAVNLISDKNTPLYVYCHSGARSRSATRVLQSLGYRDVTDLGGMVSYRGKVVK